MVRFPFYYGDIRALLLYIVNYIVNILYYLLIIIYIIVINYIVITRV